MVGKEEAGGMAEEGRGQNARVNSYRRVKSLTDVSFWLATALNALDLITSFIAFQFGAVEANVWSKIVHNSYIACLIAFALSQASACMWHFLSRRHSQLFSIPLIALIYVKLKAVSNNVLIIARLCA